MSTLFSIELRCACAATVVVRIADSLNANRMPDARCWVLDRTLFQQPCSCGRTVVALHPVLYTDFDRGLWIQVLPEDLRPDYHAREPEVLAAYHRAFDPGTGARFLPALGGLVSPRLVYGYEELREKVVAADHGLDDVIVEVLKLEVLATHPDLLRSGVMLLTLEGADAGSLQLRAHHFAPGGRGEILGDVVVSRALYTALAEREAALTESYPSLFEGVYVNVQRYRFEPAEDAATAAPDAAIAAPDAPAATLAAPGAPVAG